tara:strand:- start:190 stop:423 length:234 start_codon:yes stop_codon:yes gene_type:complete
MDIFIENKINDYAGSIISGGEKRDHHALEALNFYMATRRVEKGEYTDQDLGMMDAITEVLLEAKIIDKGQRFTQLLK